MKILWTVMIAIIFSLAAMSTAHASIPGDFAPADCDVDGSDLAALIATPGLLDLTTFAQNFGKKNACSIKLIGSSSEDRWGIVAVDSNNNVYVTGTTSGGIDGFPLSGLSDVFLIKYDSAGNKLWSRQFGSAASDGAADIRIDSNNYVYIMGITTSNFDGNINQGMDDIFLVKYDSQGNKLWSKQFGSTNMDYIEDRGMCIDSNDNVYITGMTMGSIDGNVSAGVSDVFLVKYDSSGNKLWSRQIGSTGNDSGKGAACDSTGIYITGNTMGDFDGHTFLGSGDIILIKYDFAGNKLWSRQYGTTANDLGFAVATDKSGNIYVTGATGGSIDSNPNQGSSDIFVSKYDGSGNRLWTKQVGTTGGEAAHDLAIDNLGNIYLTGNTNGSFVGYSNSGSNDICLIKLDSTGTTLWVRQTGTAQTEEGISLSLDSNGDIFVAGETQGNLGGVINNGSYDVFLMKYNSSGVLQ